MFAEVRTLLAGLDPLGNDLNTTAAGAFHQRLQEFQNEYRNDRWGRVRIVRHWQLLLVEKGLAIATSHDPHPSEGYKLAADYCQNYDPTYGNSLNGPSATKITEIVRWMFTHEALEEAE